MVPPGVVLDEIAEGLIADFVLAGYFFLGDHSLIAQMFGEFSRETNSFDHGLEIFPFCVVPLGEVVEVRGRVGGPGRGPVPLVDEHEVQVAVVADLPPTELAQAEDGVATTSFGALSTKLACDNFRSTLSASRFALSNSFVNRARSASTSIMPASGTSMDRPPATAWALS